MPNEVVTDLAPTYPVVAEELLPTACHRTDRHANNRIEADHGRLKARLGPMRGLRQENSARVVIAGHAIVQKVRRGHYELAAEEPVKRRLAVAFDELALRSEAPPTVTTPARANRPDTTRPLAEPSPPSSKATPGVPSGQVCGLHGDYGQRHDSGRSMGESVRTTGARIGCPIPPPRQGWDRGE